MSMSSCLQPACTSGKAPGFYGLDIGTNRSNRPAMWVFDSGAPVWWNHRLSFDAGAVVCRRMLRSDQATSVEAPAVLTALKTLRMRPGSSSAEPLPANLPTIADVGAARRAAGLLDSISGK